MLFTTFLPNFAGLLGLVLASLNSPSRGESLATILQHVHLDDFADRTEGKAGTGTTLNLTEIVVGRCWDYQRVTGMEKGKPDSQVDCDNTAWPAFVKAFAYKDPCSTPDDAFRDFILTMTVNLPMDGTIFWSGTKYLAMMYSMLSGGTMFSLETTFLGYTVDGLTWCGATTGGQQGINYHHCPPFADPSCESSVSKVFWGAASMAFAKQARGRVTVLLNGSDPGGAFRNNSFFATIELPNLKTSAVDLVNIIVVHDLDGQVVDTCDTGTVKTLKNRIAHRGLKWTCQDDPRLARLILCTENLDNEKCSLASKTHLGWYLIVFAFATVLWTIEFG
ncbi:ADP-ribosyl cyclase/cyclic ADP-ribose hydrolase-like [Acanthaster planci]|uniref:ADP-ribosyl cyclase/cyclic ADP-ribose hydrolase-like n=1 Tax=Acanthaster planci TaxID=133434 RepID=A0A8B7ZFP5_ACAPL|nr:ADP-ribosyl cyclase/cyclic ADP-ribose hydrolase-like [Acanthaster planci]